MAFRFDAFHWQAKGLLLLEAALALGLAVQGARLFWLLVMPAGAFGLPPSAPPALRKADFAVLSRFDPFFRGMPETAIAAGGGGSFTLFGVRTAGARSTAILGGPDGRQDSYTLGQTVAPGVVLAAVERDHVILMRSGVRMRIAFQAPAPTAYVPLPPARATAAPPEQGGTIAPKEFLSQTGFEPQMQGSEIRGYAVAPRDGGKILAAAGLQPGDIIRAINGSPLSRHRFNEIEAEFTGAAQVELTIERAGQTITRKLQVAK